MELDVRMSGGGKQRVSELLTSVRLQQRGGQPRRFESMNEMPGLAEIGCPEHIVLGRSRSIVGKDHVWGTLLDESGVPAVDGGNHTDHWRLREREVSGRIGHPLHEGLPEGLGLFFREPLAGHLDIERVAWPHVHDLTPVRIVKAVGVEADESANQLAESGRGRRLDGHRDEPEEVWQLVGAERHPCDDAETAAAATLESPEKVRMRAGIGDPHHPVRGDDLRLQQACRSRAVLLGIASESASENEARDADRPTAAALYIAATLGGYLVVGMYPDRAGPNRHGGLRYLLASATVGDEGIPERDVVHGSRPDQQGIRRVGGAKITVAAALDDQPHIVLAGKVDGSDDIFRSPSRHRIDARLRRPGVDPARGLRQRDLIADVVRILQLAEDVAAGPSARRPLTSLQRRLHLHQTASRLLVERGPTSCRGPCAVPRPDSGCRESLYGALRACQGDTVPPTARQK